MNGILGWVVAAIAIVIGGYYFWSQSKEVPAPAAETGTEQQTPVTQNTAGDPRMAGLWQSTTDVKFTREIRADGVMIDRYVGDVGAGVGGQWSVVDPTKETVLASRAEALGGMTVIKVVWEGGVETTYFSVNKLADTSMTTTDLTGRGAVTIYNKVTMTP